MNAQTSLLQREFSYTSDLAPNASLMRSENFDSAILAIGDYQLRWSAVVGTQEQVLASSSFSVRGFNIGGNINAAPTTVTVGAPVSLTALVSNTGNIVASALPVRIEVRRADTQSVVSSWNENISVAAGANATLNRQFESTAAGAGQYLAVLLAQLNGQYQTLSNVPFEVQASATDVRMNLNIQRDARVQVLASCEPGQVAFREAQLLSEYAARATEAITAAELPDAASTVCETEKKAWLENLLSGQGLSFNVVLDAEEFANEMRCGKYNVYWLSGGSAKLSQAPAQELAELIYRGEGLLQVGSHDQRNNLIDGIAGYAYRGKRAQADQIVQGSGSLIASTQVTSLGKALRLETAGAQIEANFVGAATPAILSYSFGQGHALTYAFDSVATMKTNVTPTTALQLFKNGLSFVAPTVLAPDHAVGSYLAVTTTLDNCGAQIDLRCARQ